MDEHRSITIADAKNSFAYLLQHLQRIGVSHLPRASQELEAAARQMVVPVTAPSNEVGSVQDKAVAVNPSVDLEATGAPESVKAPPPPRAAPVNRPSDPLTVKPAAQPVVGNWNKRALPVAKRQTALAELSATVAACTRCELLACRRKNTVFGEGNASPKVCFFGEAPGADEDRMGRPFVGASGQLLDKIIGACTFRREDVYILNTVKCRPPENRNPTDAELANCREYFVEQLEILQPAYIVCLGLVAAKALIPMAASIGRMRGRFHTYGGAKVVVTYHPSYLLRTPSAKAATWEDLKMLMRDMGIDVTQKRNS